MTREVITRRDAKSKGLNCYFTAKACKHGHVSERRTASGKCLECERQYYSENMDRLKFSMRKWREANPGYGREYREKNLEDIVEQERLYREKNKPEVLNRQRMWRESNRDRVIDYSRQYRKENPEKRAALQARRRAARIQRTLCIEGIDDDVSMIYEKAEHIRRCGRDVHVDHIAPLCGEFVSGLHVPWNLRIVDASENMKKNNRFDPLIEIYDHNGNVTNTITIERA